MEKSPESQPLQPRMFEDVGYGVREEPEFTLTRSVEALRLRPGDISRSGLYLVRIWEVFGTRLPLSPVVPSASPPFTHMVVVEAENLDQVRKMFFEPKEL